MSAPIIEFEQEEDGRWIADVPAHPGVMAYGNTRETAEIAVLRLLIEWHHTNTVNAQDALAEALETNTRLNRRAQAAEASPSKMGLEEAKDKVNYLSGLLALKNRELDAMHFVWCDGGCAKGVARYEDHQKPTEEVVQAAIRNTERLVRWFKNESFRAVNEKLKLDPEDVRNAYEKWWHEAMGRHMAAEKQRDEARAELTKVRAEAAALWVKAHYAACTNPRCGTGGPCEPNPYEAKP